MGLGFFKVYHSIFSGKNLSSCSVLKMLRSSETNAQNLLMPMKLKPNPLLMMMMSFHPTY